MGADSEHARLRAAREGREPWKRWGPYLSERQWGTVREDYSDNGDAWNYFTHDQARSRAYRWGEDGIAGLCDEQQQLCVALALWNGADPILKERLFGLTNGEGNHGEDVKEYYFYLDSTPTHSYLKYLYKYPQSAYPYDELVRANKARGRHELEYELLDTGIFDDDRYFDVFVEYAKATPEDILMQITVCNRGDQPATLHVLPTFWFRNTWATRETAERPVLRQITSSPNGSVIRAVHPDLGERFIYSEDPAELLFTDNETNSERISYTRNGHAYVKDGINDYVVHGRAAAVNPQRQGTKSAVHYRITVGAGDSYVLRLRMSDSVPGKFTGETGTYSEPFGAAFGAVVSARRREADEFYATIIPPSLSPDAASVMRQALAGMLWSKQFYLYDLERWLNERKAEGRGVSRNAHWRHMHNADIISMPDKWEYPWYAAWDLAFHILALTLVDEDFAKEQLDLMLRGNYLHPNGQLPAYEWNFGDVNPPVHAWSTIFTYRFSATRSASDRANDLDWLERSFHTLLLNFTWWVNRKDRLGKNVFEGGFLGLDNIGVFDRSAPLPTGGFLEQADGTAWMALFCQNMLEIAIELALARPTYVRMCLKFVEHFLWIASSMVEEEGTGMWDEEDGFFYDVLRLPNGTAQRLKVRSMVGLLPLCAVTVFDGELNRKYPHIGARIRSFVESHPELTQCIHDPFEPGQSGRHMLSIMNETRLRRVLERMLDENEFLSPYGIRSLSHYHLQHPFVFPVGEYEYRVPYLPAESDSGMFGGNSNWRGPVWMPVNALIVRALLQYYSYYGDDFTVECPTGSGNRMTLYEVAEELVHRLSAIFLRDVSGQRPVYGGTEKFQTDPHWRDYVQFFEYFHGDNGAGLGASHQTGWTGIIARLMHVFATVSAEQLLELGKEVAVADREDRPRPGAAGSTPQEAPTGSGAQP